MAGHSKFKNIQHRKGAQDRKRAQLFAKLGREITVSAKLGGGDPNMNARLRLAIANAKAQSMPRDNIEKAVQKGTGGGDLSNYVEMRYEGYGPGGTAIIIDALTDNKNRTAGEIRSIFTKNNGNLGESNSVSFMFDRIGEIVYPVAVANADTMFEAALEAGASNVETTAEQHEISTTPDDFAHVRAALVAKYGEPEKSGLVWKPNVMAPVSDEQAADILELIEALEENDDVQNVTSNVEISDSAMEKLMASG